MKILIVIITICYYPIMCQNNDPEPLKFSNSQETNENLSDILNPPDKFIRGWQWGLDLKLSDPRALYDFRN